MKKLHTKPLGKTILVLFMCAMTLACGIPKMLLCRNSRMRVSRQQAQQLLLPIAAFPGDWAYQTPQPGDELQHSESYYHAQRFVLAMYHNTAYPDDSTAWHDIAVYGSEDCALADSSQWLNEQNYIGWEPLRTWRYTSPIADEYDFKITYFPDRGCGPSRGRLRVRVLARYGVVISDFYAYLCADDVTPDQVKALVIALDDQFAANRAVWDR